MDRNIFAWVKETKVIDITRPEDASKVNELIKSGYKVINNRTEKILRFDTRQIGGKLQVITFEVMVTRYVLGR